LTLVPDPFLVLVLVDGLSFQGPLKDLSEMDIVLMAVFNQLSEDLIGLEVLVEAAEYSTSHHDTALLQAGGD
jgi:hypothetical protein